MITTVWGVVQQGKVELPSDLSLADGSRVLVTSMTSDEERDFWFRASQTSLDKIWNNAQDDVYAELLKE